MQGKGLHLKPISPSPLKPPWRRRYTKGPIPREMAEQLDSTRFLLLSHCIHATKCLYDKEITTQSSLIVFYSVLS